MRKFLLIALSLFALPALSDTLYVSEFTSSPPVYVAYQAAKAPAITSQAVTITASSVQSAAFSATTGLIRIHCDVACHVQIGTTNPTATTSSLPLGAGQTEYFVVTPGDEIAVIAGAAP